ncbi:MAG TPA: GntR family transcriptional regulator [Streptosporangiaceae bacterium]
MEASDAENRPMFRPARPKRAVDQIVAQVEGLLRDGKLRPGDRLPSERALAEQFAVSRNTVREALRILEFNGMLMLKRGSTGGAFVTHPDPEGAARGIADALDRAGFPSRDLKAARTSLKALIGDAKDANPVLVLLLHSLDATTEPGGTASTRGVA